jgi:hypothetical protein
MDEGSTNQRTSPSTVGCMPRSRSKVDLYEQIRKVRDREQISVRELSLWFRVHRRDERAVPRG